MKNLFLVIPALVICSAFIARHSDAVTILSDSMDDPSNWTTAVGSSASYNSSIDSLTLGNGVIYQSLGTELTEDFSLTFTANSSSASRNIEVMLLDSTGTQGYGVYITYDSSGNASVNIVKFDYSSDPTLWADWFYTSAVTLLTDSGSDLPDYQTLTLTWDSTTDQLSLYVDGSSIALLSGTDTDFSSFSSVYIRGNSNAQFTDYLTVTSTVPEPATLPLAVLVGLAACVWRLKRRNA